ncbi:MAG: CHASE2 domain-containing protein [Armatimonadota bacterium]
MAGDPTLSRRRAEIRHRGIMTAALIAILVVVMRYVPLTSDLFIFPLIENFAYDMAYEHAFPQPPQDIIIVEIDDVSLQPQHQGRWPWSRRTHAELVRKLATARVIALDVIFSEPERAAPGETETPDEEFARAIREAGNVVLAAHHAREMEYTGVRADVSWGYRRPDGRLSGRIVQAENLMPPTAPLAEAAAAIGYVDITPDSDGVFRRARPLSPGSDGVVYPHFGAAIAVLASGVSGDEIARQAARGAISVSGEVCPLDSEGRMLIDYCGPTGTIDRVSAWEVLEGRVDPSRFRDRIVLVGASALGLHDIRPAPYRWTRRQFLGVETNANVANNLLHTGSRTPATRSLVWAIFALTLGLAVGWLAWSLGDRLGPLLAALLVVAVALPSFFFAFAFMDSVIPYAAIVLASTIPLAVAIPERLGRDKKLIQGQFSAYVSPDVLRQLTDEPDLVAHGTRREVTLLFADVRGSTALSESIEAEVWVAQLNEYLSQMSDAIFEHDGYLDKFMGDGIMALWNAFGNQPNHAELAMKAALEMLRRLEVLNGYWERHEQRTPFRIGIAIHSGEAIVGNVGSDQRMQYTAIGDSVNTAARIEGMTKVRGVQFLASETAAARISSEIARLTEIGETEVRGREQPVTIFRLAGEEPVES